MKYYSQLDPEYCHNTLGDSNYTIKRWGCTATSLCNLIGHKLNKAFSPKLASELWSYTKTGLLVWGSVKYGTLKHVCRAFGQPKHSVCSEYINDADKGIIFEVGYTHWVYPVQWGWKWWPYFLCVDPYTLKDGNAKIVKMRKSSITGSSLFNL